MNTRPAQCNVRPHMRMTSPIICQNQTKRSCGVVGSNVLWNLFYNKGDSVLQVKTSFITCVLVKYKFHLVTGNTVNNFSNSYCLKKKVFCNIQIKTL